jgi:cell division GTPase FtsZ
LNNKSNYRIHTNISEGGAGKSIRFGEIAIRSYKEDIIDIINLNKDLNASDTIWLIAGLGGGTGSLGIIQMSMLLSKIGRKHSMIITTPAHDEGTTEKANALVSGMQIYNLIGKSKNLRSLIIMDN